MGVSRISLSISTHKIVLCSFSVIEIRLQPKRFGGMKEVSTGRLIYILFFNHSTYNPSRWTLEIVLFVCLTRGHGERYAVKGLIEDVLRLAGCFS